MKYTENEAEEKYERKKATYQKRILIYESIFSDAFDGRKVIYTFFIIKLKQFVFNFRKKFKLTFCHAELIKLMHGVFLGAKNILLWFYYVALQAINVKTFRAHHAVAGAEKSR